MRRQAVLAALLLCAAAAGAEDGSALLSDAPDARASTALRPQNLTATYKGSWTSLRGFSADGDAGAGAANASSAVSLAPWLSATTGTVILLLQTYATVSPAVQYVSGEVTLRDGDYATPGDVRLPFEGVYVPSTGELRLLLESDAILNVTAQERARLGDSYRSALHEAAAELGELQKRTLLHPELAPQVARLWDADGSAAAEPGSEGIAGLRKRCRFRLVSSVAPRALAADGLPAAAIAGVLHSPNCGVRLNVSAEEVHLASYMAKAENFSLMATATTVALILLVHAQLEAAGTQAGVAKLSLLCFGQQAVMDSYLCLVLLTTGLVVDELFPAFSGAAFLQFVLFSFFEMKAIVLIWKARRPDAFQDGWRREMGVLHSYFYGALLGGVVLLYQLQAFVRAWLFVFLGFWWWQIAHSARADAARPLLPRYVVGTSLARLALPLYVYGCPQNFLRTKPDLGLCAALVGWVGLQAGLLLSQHYCGPRWFVPRRWRPQKYNYHRPVPAAVLAAAAAALDMEGGPSGGIDCVICMAPVDVAAGRRHMVTPCDHVFHPACLERWADVKLECPTCRRPLPLP